jgi:sigma-E factor negative regulatory protein RseA
VKDALFEQISALADGELPSRERELLLRRLEADPEARERWTRYHQIGEMMRGGAILKDSDLADRVRDALGDEPEHRAVPSVPAWVRPLAGMAIAASVTAVAVLAIRAPQPETDLSPVASAPIVTQVDDSVSVRAAAMRATEEQARLRQRMDAYLINYAEAAAATRPQGLLEFVHVTRQGDLAQPGSEDSAADGADAPPAETTDVPE